MFRLLLLVTLISVLACGCGGGDGQVSLALASGVVTYKGKPIEGASVTFVAEGSSVASSARTDSQGNFKLTTFADGDGAVVGENIVTVVMSPPSQVGDEKSSAMMSGTIDPSNKDAAANAARKISEQMSKGMANQNNPALVAAEKAKRANNKAGKGASLIPAKYADPKKSGLKFPVAKSQPNQFKIDLTD